MSERKGPVSVWIRGCLSQRLLVLAGVALIVFAGLLVAPFDFDLFGLPRDPVAVDAIPDLGENQQVVFTAWPGRSPQDIDDQISYPLTVALLGVPDVTEVRSTSIFGFSTIYVIFDEHADFYDSRTRILEKLASLPANSLPEGVAPALGPDATALGQVFWYTLEGRDDEGRPAGGWDPQELRTIQDFDVRYRLASVEGVAEVASIGGFVEEFQIDIDPDRMRAAEVTLEQVIAAVRESNLDVGARTLEINRVEYVVRGLGLVGSVEDLEQTAIVARDGVPLRLVDIAQVILGPALRRGALTKGGTEAVGGVVVVRHGANPMQVLQHVKQRIAEFAPSLPTRELEDGRRSHLTVVPFYDRSELIDETLGTLRSAITQQVLVTIVVVVLLLFHLRSALLVSAMLPLAVLATFVGMKLLDVEANIVALSGIAIAVGTIVDMGIVLTENIVRRLDEAPPEASRLDVVRDASLEVGPAVLTAVLTTVVSFLPVFTMQGAEGKLFQPLAWTKTLALAASIVLALSALPIASYFVLRRPAPRRRRWRAEYVLVAVLGVVLARYWEPLGPGAGILGNLLFLIVVFAVPILGFIGFRRAYPALLAWTLGHKALALLPALLVVVGGVAVWRGTGSEFMPSLDEGSFLYMPTTMPHASIGEALDVVATLDRAILSVPEVESAVGKIGRVDSALDPAPISMIETVIEYRDEYGIDEDGRRVRQWRDSIHSPDDIWREIVAAAKIPGTTSAPKLQPIETRRVMLQSGFRAPMGVKVFGPDLESIEAFGLALEPVLKSVPEVEASAVFANRVVGKPYLEIDIDRERIARYGISVADVQRVIEVAIGGKPLTTVVDGRKRSPVRVRMLRERRDDLDSIGAILVAAPDGRQVPLVELADLRTRRGPQSIQSEDTFLVSYVLFDAAAGQAEVEVVEAARRAVEAHIASGDLRVPPGVSYEFAGSYQNQVRAWQRLKLVLPLSLLLILLLLHMQFRSLPTSLIVFSAVFVAWGGGFLLLWLYGQPWFLDANLFGVDLRELFQVHPYNLSVAVWVGFLALFGIASDDGVVMVTRIQQSLAEQRPKRRSEVRAAVLEGATRRVRAALLTTATTLLALLPVLTSTGRGSDVMVPMALPTFGGMLVALLTLFTVPVLHSAWEERGLEE